MSVSKRNLGLLVTSALVFATLFAATTALAEIPEEPLHWSSDKTLWDRKANVVDLQGNAKVNKINENLAADRIVLDLNKRILRARGNCVYVTPATTIHADEMHFNVDTGAGTIIGGRVTNGQFLLVGKRINRLAPERFQAHRAEYTTCWDCPGSWAFEADSIDLQFEGYAHLRNVITKVGGTPILWFPYLLLPMKTERQTGLLFPLISFSPGSQGLAFVPQFFWATSRSTDMTLGAGTYTERGLRLEWEGRYVLSARSRGTANAYYTYDKKSPYSQPYRYALKFAQTQELPFGVEEKANLFYLSDNFYPISFTTDVPGYEDAVVTSDVMVSKSSPALSAHAAARIYRNMLWFTNPNITAQTFDPKTVQLLPRAEFTLNTQQLLDTPIQFSMTGGLSHFWRDEAHFDRDCESTNTCVLPLGSPTLGTDPIRRGIRYHFQPTVALNLRPFDIFSFVPSASLYGYYYDFQTQMPNLTRGYLLTQAELSLQLDRVFDTDYKDYPKIRHTIRPTLKYSLIPMQLEDSTHPFMRQIAREQGYKFDNRDVVPYSKTPSIDSYYTPLGHSLSYGLVTQWARRSGTPDGLTVPGIETFLEFTAGQSIDFTQFQADPATRVPFTRFYLTKTLSLSKVSWTTNYFYYPYVVNLVPQLTNNNPSPHWVSTEMKYTFESGQPYGVLTFERSAWARFEYRNLTSSFSNLKGGITFSLSDYIQPAADAEYEFLANKLQKVNASLTFQSPARCWRIRIGMSRDFVTTENAVRFDFLPEFNWMGSGFGSFDVSKASTGGK